MTNTLAVRADRWRRHKLAAIPVLLVVLALAIRGNLSRPEAPPTHVPAEQPGVAGSTNALPIRPNVPAAAEKAPWPPIDIQQIVAHDPFVPWLMPEPIAEIDGAHTTPQANLPGETTDNGADADAAESVVSIKRIQALYRDKENTAAIVDSRIIRPGDVLDGGAQVIGVTPEGITVRSR